MKRALTILVCIFLFQNQSRVWAQESKGTARWLQRYDFNPASFRAPHQQFGPFARWWWPGNFVDSAELKREIRLFAQNHFGGLEIQTLNLFIPGGADTRSKVNSWDTPGYYEHVISVMKEARERGLTIDMTDGSGWPPGGAYLDPDDGFLTLAFGSVDLDGGKPMAIKVPTIDNRTGGHSILQAVIAAKTIVNDPNTNSKTVMLDSTSSIILTSQVKNDSIRWSVPPGKWKLIAFWNKPQGEMTMTASPKQGPVVDHFDSTKVLKSYNYLFGKRTGLTRYFGNPMRAVFDDSFEFAVDRHYSLNFFEYFKQHRGYDITKWLPAEMRHNYNYVTFKRQNSADDFTFSNQDWRLKYDYDLTISELLNEEFMDATKNWLEPQGLLHRTQGYGMILDMIAVAGHASIPETETMLGPEANLKIMTSGGHLYNKPIISAESVVYSGRAYTNTPQKIKIAVDKLFAAGVNQIVFHGIPYRYTPPEFGPEGWYPFSTPMIAAVNFSSNLGEGNLFWKDQKEVNDYISRTQYALRSGKAHADVLIYFPFMDVDGMPANPEEIMADGVLKGVEGPLPPSKDAISEQKVKWAAVVYPLINQLESRGVTWDWVNDESLQKATLTNDKLINIRGNVYQALLLPETAVIQLKTAQVIKELSSHGLNFAAIGTLPDKQPSYLNWQENDALSSTAIKSALTRSTGKYLKSSADVDQWIKSFHLAVRFSEQYKFTRQTEREMSDGSRIQFILNKSPEWQNLSLTIDANYKASYWFDADRGTIFKNTGFKINYRLAPYGSIILYAQTNSAKPLVNVSPQNPTLGKGVIVDSLTKWSLKTDSLNLDNTQLFDWRKNPKLKFSSDSGVYTATFYWKGNNGSSRYILDLGDVYYTADVRVNGKVAGKRIFAPYSFDVTSLLHKGQNAIEVKVVTGQLNGFIGRARIGDPRYKQFKNKEDQVMAAGLIGPVVIKSVQVK